MSNVEQLDTEITALIAEMEAALAVYEQGLNHINLIGNVHNISKYDLDLSNLQNMSLATSLEVIVKADNKYHPSGGTYLQLERTAISTLVAHVANKNNPHKTSLAQLNMLSEIQIRALFNNRLLKTEGAYDSALLNGQNQAALVNQTKVNLDASNIGEGVIPPARFAESSPFGMFSGQASFTNTLAPTNVVNNFIEHGENDTPDQRLWHTMVSPARVVMTYGDADHFHSITDPDNHSSYGADITLSSDSPVDGWLGFVIADFSNDTKTRQFVARVRPGRDTPGKFEICLIDNESVITLTEMDHTLGDNLQNGWSGKTIRMRIERMDQFVRVTVGNWNSTQLNLTQVLSVDLSLYDADAPAPMGYFAQGGSLGTFSNTTFSTVSDDDYALSGNNSFIHMLTALVNAGGSTGNFHLVSGEFNDITACWNAMAGANVPIGTYLVGHYKRAFQWQIIEGGAGYGIPETHYMFHMVAGRRNVDGTTTRIF